jgi:hypothetical protein
VRSAAVAAWLAISAALTVPAFLWHVTQFSKPGPAFVYLLVAAFLAIGAAAVLYHRWPRAMDWLFLAAPLAILLVYRPWSTAAVALIAVSAWLLGSAILTTLRLDLRGHAAAIALPSLAGFGAITFALFGLGSAGWLAPPAWLVVLLAPVVFFKRLPDLWRAIAGIARSWAAGGTVRSPLITIATVFVAAFACLSAVMAVLPATAGDVVAAHLPLARYYVASHTMHPPEALGYGWFPQAFEILAAYAWFLGGQGASQILALWFFVLALLVLAAAAYECGCSRAESAIAVILAAAVPAVHWTGSVAKNDLLMAAWILAALYGVLRGGRWLLFSAAMTGLAFQVKHVALFGALAIGVLWLESVWRSPRRWKTAAALCALFLAFGTFSVVRAWLATGNPVYPERASRSINPVTNRKGAERLRAWVTLPVSLQFDGGRYFESSSRSPLAASFFVFAPVALMTLRRRWSRPWKLCATFTGVYLLYWSLIIPGVLRYAIPAWMVLCLLMAPGLVSLASAPSMWLRRSTIAAFAYCLGFGWLVALMIGSYPAELGWLAKRADNRAYLRASIQPFRALEFLERTAPDDDVLAIEACVGLYAPDPARLFGLCGPKRPFPTALAIEWFRKDPDFRWVVVPNQDGPELVRALGQERPLRHVYGDPLYSVYAVEPRRQ